MDDVDGRARTAILHTVQKMYSVSVYISVCTAPVQKHLKSLVSRNQFCIIRIRYH